MIVITKATMKLMDKIYFHDAEVSTITCNYVERIVEIPLKLDVPRAKSTEALLRFEGVLRIDVSLRQLSGALDSIFEVNVSEVPEENYFLVNILLCSQDTINVVASKVTYLPSDH